MSARVTRSNSPTIDLVVYTRPVVCPKMNSCALFPLFSKAAFLRIWQINFCESDQYARCARFQAVCNGESVAATLLPNGKHLPVVNSNPPESK